MEKDKKNKSIIEIKRGVIISYLTLAVNICAGFFYTPWLIKSIGQSDYGLYTLATSFISIFLFDFGISAAVSKFANQYIASGEQEKVDKFVSTAYKLYIFVDAIILGILVLGYCFIHQIYGALSTNEIEKFKVVYLIVGLYSILSFPFITLTGVLNAYEKFAFTKLCELIQKLGTVAVMVVILLFGGGLYELVLVNALMGLFVCFLKLVAVKKQTPVTLKFSNAEKAYTKEIFGYSIFSTISSLAQRLIFNLMPTILGIVTGSVAIAIFGVGSTLEGYAYMISGAVNGMFFPKISRIVKNENYEESLLNLMVRVGRLQFSIISFIFVGFLCVGRDFILLWVGTEYMPAYIGTLALLLPSLLRVPQQIAQTAMLATGKVKTQAWVYCVAAGVNILLAFPMAYYWGALGAMLSICIANIVRFIIMNCMYHKKLNLNIFSFAKRCYFAMSLPLIVTCVVGILCNYLFGDITWLNFLLRVVIITFVYWISMWFTTFNKEEKNLFLSIFKRGKNQHDGI